MALPFRRVAPAPEFPFTLAPPVIFNRGGHMADETKITDLRKAFTEATGKNPSPRDDAATLQTKIDAAKAESAKGGGNGGGDELEALKAKLAAAEARADEAEGKLAEVAEASDAAPVAPMGTALLDHDDADVTASFMGAELVRGDNGLFLVPLSAVEELKAHGFHVVSGEVA
jgi:hypothetical protein